MELDMTTIEIVESTESQVQRLGQIMNDEDRAEAEALGLKAHRALWRGWKNSTIRRTAIIDGDIGAMWGVYGSLMGGIGTVWLVTSHKVREISPHRFIALYRKEVRDMLEVYPTLVNVVDDRYNGAKRMLKLSGFTVEKPMPVGKYGYKFCQFHKEA